MNCDNKIHVDAKNPYVVMTVCTGNICRSPMAEIVLRNEFQLRGLGDVVAVKSSGVAMKNMAILLTIALKES